MTLEGLPDPPQFDDETLRRLGPEGRFLLTCRLSDAAHEMAREKVRAAHPELDERGVIKQLVFELYGIRI